MLLAIIQAPTENATVAVLYLEHGSMLLVIIQAPTISRLVSERLDLRGGTGLHVELAEVEYLHQPLKASNCLFPKIGAALCVPF